MKVEEITVDCEDVVVISYQTPVSCGFPSPATDFFEAPLKLADLLIENPNATFFARATGNSMRDRGILDGAILAVDRSKKVVNGDIVIAVVNNEMTCKEIDVTNKKLISANPDYPDIVIEEDFEVVIQGVVTYAINPIKS